MDNDNFSLTPEEYYILANTAFEEKDYENSVKYYSEYLQHVKGDFEAYFSRGKALLQLKKFSEAIGDLDKAIEINPATPGIYKDRGVAYLKLNKFEEALKNFNHEIDMGNDSADVYCFRGILFSIFKKYDEAIDNYKKAIAIDPDYAPPYTNLGNIYLLLKDYDESQKYFETAIEANPELAPSYNSLACMLLQKGDYVSSLLNLNKAIELQPEYPDAYHNRGFIHVKNKNFSFALSDFRQYEKLVSKITKEPYLRFHSRLDTEHIDESFGNSNDKTAVIKELEELIIKLKEDLPA